MKLNSLQKKILNKHSNNYRYIYNKAISILNGDDKKYDHSGIIERFTSRKEYDNKKIIKSSTSNFYSKFNLRNLIVPNEVNCRNTWLYSNSSIKSCATFEAHKNYKTNIDLIKSGNKKFFNMKYKSKKDIKWTIDVSKDNIKTQDYKNKTEFSLYEETGFIKTTEQFSIKHDCSIHFDGKYYYILAPYEKPKIESKAENFHTAIDPGIRKFLTCYSPDGDINIIGQDASSKIYKLLVMIDNAISNKNKKLEVKLRRRVSNLQKELHDKTSRFLCENYLNIYIPKLTSGNDIINKNSRKIKTKTVRNMVLLAHCKFVEKLKTKALDYNNVNVHEVTEEYTSQTCPFCKNRTKTTSEIFTCKYCKFKIDRDILGSRNILLKTWNLM